MLKLQIIIAGTRQGRVGAGVGRWMAEQARAHGAWDVDLIDLAEVDLPFTDEPNHPRLRKYVHQHTRDWADKIDQGDAYVFVSPEYNHGMSAPLKNAIDYLHHEWQYKPVAFVSYGGVGAGVRATEHIKTVVSTLKMVPIFETVAIPFIGQQMEDGNLKPTDALNASAKAMLDETQKWAEGLKAMRDKAKAAAPV